MIDSGIDLQELSKTLVFYLRQSLLLKISPGFLNIQNSGFSAPELEKLKTQTDSLSEKNIQNMLEYFIEAENKMKYSTLAQLPIELAIINITHQES
jgi:DNA polymerase III gamma/tau subunit